MSVGFGLMLLIAFTSGEVNVGIGVGGFLVILGLGFFFVSLLSAPPRCRRICPDRTAAPAMARLRLDLWICTRPSVLVTLMSQSRTDDDLLPD